MDLVTRTFEILRQRGADEPSCTGDGDAHAAILSGDGRVPSKV
jgi:hypothetical protein